MELQKRRALETGKVWDAFGRVRRVTGALSTLKRIRAKALREAGNMPIQSSAQGMIKLCMAESMEMVNRLRQAGLRVLPLLQIHDELIFEVDEREAEEFGQLLREIFRNCCRLRVAHDASCSTGKRWNELK
jgi:DNA polymerase-1